MHSSLMHAYPYEESCGIPPIPHALVPSDQVSIVDHVPSELAAVTVSGMVIEHAAGLGEAGAITNVRVHVENIQLDDQTFGSRCTP